MSKFQRNAQCAYRQAPCAFRLALPAYRVHEAGEDGLLGEKGMHIRRQLATGQRLAARLLYGAKDAFNIAMSRAVEWVSAIELVEERGDVAGTWANIENGGANAENIVDLAGVNEADEGIAHDDDMQVGSGKGSGEFVQRLVRETERVAPPDF